MKNTGLLSRRFIVGSAVVSGVALAAFGLPKFIGSLSDSEDSTSILKKLMEDPNALAHFGHLYVEKYPNESEPLILESKILESAGLAGKTVDMPQLIAELQNKIRDDYTAESTVRLDGWLLSLTEARLCALAVS